MDQGTFRFVHISDLHFSLGAYILGTHQHSIPRLQGIERVISGIDFDRLIVSGDITNDGGGDSLLRASEWLFDSFRIDATTRIGLSLPPEKVGVVPRNHDAFNANSSGQAKLAECWQKSLENYNRIFPRHRFPPEESGCRYDWVEKNGRSVFIVYVDTCFLGDQELENRSDFEHILKRIPKIARGRFLQKQTEQLLAWFQLGLKGKLAYPHDPSRLIPREVFATSLKVLVAHHFFSSLLGTSATRCFT